MPCTLDEVLGPPTTPEGRNDENALLEQLVSFLSGTDESELAELDKADLRDVCSYTGNVRKAQVSRPNAVLFAKIDYFRILLYVVSYLLIRY